MATDAMLKFLEIAVSTLIFSKTLGSLIQRTGGLPTADFSLFFTITDSNSLMKRSTKL
jgi:hypothetical protein